MVQATDRGYTYELANVDGGYQTLQFIRKEKNAPEDTKLETMINGTTNEAVIEVLIDRLQVLNEIKESEFNTDAIRHLEDALDELNKRTADRETRGVEGTTND